MYQNTWKRNSFFFWTFQFNELNVERSMQNHLLFSTCVHAFLFINKEDLWSYCYASVKHKLMCICSNHTNHSSRNVIDVIQIKWIIGSRKCIEKDSHVITLINSIKKKKRKLFYFFSSILGTEYSHQFYQLIHVLQMFVFFFSPFLSD